MPRVLFVSKPVAPPFTDGTKCLVRDIASHLTRFQAVVMSTVGAPLLDGHGAELVQLPVYGNAGSYSPRLRDNARAALWLGLRSRADVWHVVFSPNPRTSLALGWLRRLRRVPTVQTVASPPRNFRDIGAHLFGDTVVVQSEWTRSELLAHVPEARIELIPPPVAPLRPRSPDEQAKAREEAGVPAGAPFLVYPGDLETSCGAEHFARLVEELSPEFPDLHFVFAYRAKSPEASEVAQRLARRLPAERTRIAGLLSDLVALLGSASAVVFPVDDLTGKVDLPIVLLEAMQLGAPVVAYDYGPLRELGTPLLVPTRALPELIQVTRDLLTDKGLRESVAGRQREEVTRRFFARTVAREYERIYEQLLARER